MPRVRRANQPRARGDAMSAARSVLAVANYLVCALNIVAWTKSRESRDFWAAVA